MALLTVVDFNNWFRMRVESGQMFSPVRNCFAELQNVNGSVIVIADGAGGLKPRRAIFPDYKNRPSKPTESFWETMKMFKQIIEFSKATFIEVPGYEADDVIAAVVLRSLQQGLDPKQIFIQSNDADLMRLGVPMARGEFHCKPEYIDIYKTMVGDSSDAIPGAKQFGKVSWEKLTDDQIGILAQIITNGERMSEEEVRGKVADFYPKGALDWFVNAENRKLLLIYYRVICFVPVSMQLINEHTKVGLNRPDLAQPIFQQFML